MLHVRPVLPGLPDEVSPVGGGVEKDVVRFGLHPALNHRFEELILHLVLLKGEVINKNNEPVIPVFHLGNHRRQVPELMLINLNHPQALVIVLVDQSLDAGGLAGAGVPIEQGVVGASPRQEGLRVVPQLRLLALVTHQVPQHDLVRVVDGDKPNPLRPRLDAEGLIQAQHPHAILPVMFRDQTEKRLVIRGRGQTAAQVPDLFTDVLVVPPPVLGNGLVMAEGGKAVQVQIPLHGRKIVVEQGPKDPKIVPGKVVHRAVLGAHPLGNQAEGVLVGHQQKGQVVLPQILVKAILCRQVQQPLDLVVNAPHQGLPGHTTSLPSLEQRRQFGQNGLFSQVSVQEQAGYQLVHCQSSYRFLRSNLAARRRPNGVFSRFSRGAPQSTRTRQPNLSSSLPS